MDKIFVVDASGYLYRAYFAITAMTNQRGETTQALFGFIRSLQKLQKDFAPQHLVAVFDGPKSIEKRKAIYSEYKAHREKMPPDLRDQIAWAREYCALAGIPELTVEGVEADDTMGAIALWAEKQGAHAYLCTSDKDMAQLVNGKISLLNTHKDNLILDPMGVENKFGVKPEQIIDYLTMIGDASDNVPGIPGFGPKTAASLLQEHGSLDFLKQHPECITAKKKRENFEESLQTIDMSRELITIYKEVEIPNEKDFYQLLPPKVKELAEFYSDKSFRTFLKELGQAENLPEEKEMEVSYQLVDDEKSLNDLIVKLQNCRELCVDTETTSEKPLQASLVGIGFGDKPGNAYYIPLNGNLGKDVVLNKVKPLLENPSIAFFGHNLKYDYHVLQNVGITIANIGFDTIIASYVLNSHNHRHSLDELTMEYFNKQKIPTSDLIGKGKKQITMDQVPIEKVSEYCCEDVDYTFRLKERLAKDLHTRKLDTVFSNIELALLPVLARMERNGIYLDVETLEAFAKEINDEIGKLSNDIFKLAGEIFNLNSPKQLSEILFEKMGIHPPKKTATGYSTNAEVLEMLSNEHEIAKKVLEYRGLEKLRSTYAEALPHQVNPKTHRIHCTFNQSVAATGRLSSQDPNLQNIPVRTELGRRIRRSFRPEKEGWTYLAADYSQIELRLVAHFSEDPRLLQAFKEGKDIHKHTAATMFEIPLEEVSYEQRYQAKAVNFGIIYGQQAFGLARELGIEIKKAKAFIDAYFERYDKIKAFLETCKEQARETGRSVTMSGRERLIPEINSKNPAVRAAAERLAINTPLQGTAADMIKMAMIQINREMQENKLKSMMILQVHDELIFEVPLDEVDQLKNSVVSCMEKAMPLKVPLVVDVAIGKNWEEC